MISEDKDDAAFQYETDVGGNSPVLRRWGRRGRGGGGGGKRELGSGSNHAAEWRGGMVIIEKVREH